MGVLLHLLRCYFILKEGALLSAHHTAELEVRDPFSGKFDLLIRWEGGLCLCLGDDPFSWRTPKLWSADCWRKIPHQHPCAFFPALRPPGSRRCGASASAGPAADSNLSSNLAGLPGWPLSPRSRSGGKRRRGPGRAGERADGRAGGGRGCAWELGASARLPGGAGAGEGPRSGGNRRAAIRGCTATCPSLSPLPDESGRSPCSRDPTRPVPIPVAGIPESRSHNAPGSRGPGGQPARPRER